MRYTSARRDTGFGRLRRLTASLVLATAAAAAWLTSAVPSAIPGHPRSGPAGEPAALTPVTPG